MAHLNLDKLRAATVETAPYMFTVVPGFLGPDSVRRINETYPNIEKGGSYPLESLQENMTIKEVIDELDGADFQKAVEDKFDVNLDDRPKMYSLRGYTRAKDGRIHTDSKDKIITVLLYLNENWSQDGGRLRILNSGTDVDDYVTEVAPDNGTLLIFKRSDNSWHGHHPFEGQRRSLQMNWMTNEGSKGWHKIRHTVSAAMKKLSATG